MKKKGNKKMPSPRHKLIHNLTSSFCFKILFVCCECIRQRKKIFTSNWLHEIRCCLERNKDVGMGAEPPERGDPPEGGVAALPTTSAGGDFGDNGL